jgi:hypothetical protein
MKHSRLLKDSGEPLAHARSSEMYRLPAGTYRAATVRERFAKPLFQQLATSPDGRDALYEMF